MNFLKSWGNAGTIRFYGTYLEKIWLCLPFPLSFYTWRLKSSTEPLLLLPIAFGMFLANLPLADLMKESEPWYTQGVLRIMYGGVKSSLFPLSYLPLCRSDDRFWTFDCEPDKLTGLVPRAQFGIYIAFMLANATGLFTVGEADAIGIIGGADGPTAIYIANNLAPDLVAPIAVAAYSYMALIPMIQPPIMKLLTTKKREPLL